MAVVDFNDFRCPPEATINITESDIEEWLWSTSNVIIITVIIPLIALIGLTANGAFLYTVFKIPSMRTHSNFFLCSLAVIDISFLIVVIVNYSFIYSMTELKHDFPYPSSLECCIVFFVTYVLYYGAMFNITLVTLERYLAICRPLKSRVNRIRNLKIFVASGVTAALVSGGLQTFNRSKMYVYCLVWPDSNEYNKYPIIFKTCGPKSRTWDIIIAIYIYFVFIVLFGLNLTAYIKMIQKLRRPAIVKETDPQKVSKHRKSSLRRQVARLLIVNGTFFFFCHCFDRVEDFFKYLPLYGINLLSKTQQSNLYFVTHTLLTLNSAANPFIYGFSSQFYRQAFYKALRLAVGMPAKNNDQKVLGSSPGSVRRTATTTIDHKNKLVVCEQEMYPMTSTRIN